MNSVLEKWRKKEDERLYTGNFNVAGVTFEGRQTACDQLAAIVNEAKGAPVKVELVPEPGNKHDHNAIKVFAVTPEVTLIHLGYVPRDMNGMILSCLPLLKEAVVESVGRVQNTGPYGVRVRYVFDADKIRRMENEKTEAERKRDEDRRSREAREAYHQESDEIQY